MSITPSILKKLIKNDNKRFCILCEGVPIQFHHAMIFGGKSVQEEFAIVPLCKNCHDKATSHNSAYQKEYEERAYLFALNSATECELKKYSKIDNLIAKRKKLNEKYENTK